MICVIHCHTIYLCYTMWPHIDLGTFFGKFETEKWDDIDQQGGIWLQHSGRQVRLHDILWSPWLPSNSGGLVKRQTNGKAGSHFRLKNSCERCERTQTPGHPRLHLLLQSREQKRRRAERQGQPRRRRPKETMRHGKTLQAVRHHLMQHMRYMR